MNNAKQYPVLLTAAQVAQRLGVSYQTPLRWARENVIRSIRLPGGQVRFREADIDAILEPTDGDSPHPDQMSLLDDEDTAVGERAAC